MSHKPPQDVLPLQYGRVTDPERFRPLHATAIALIDRAARLYNVRRTEGYSIDVELEASLALARATVVLAPFHVLQGAIAVAFTTFPGLHVRFGRGCCLAFPSCGCDACGETAVEECNRFALLAESLIAGRFREALVRSDDGTASYEWESWAVDANRRHRTHLLGEDLRIPPATDGFAYHWRAWSPRHCEVL